jgi:tRNA 2-selenouridine synthase
MVQKIAIQSLHQQLEGRVLIDVRTPAEFAKGHIPGAINLPLFTNEERVRCSKVWTLWA